MTRYRFRYRLLAEAIGLIISIGLGTWHYCRAITRTKHIPNENDIQVSTAVKNVAGTELTNYNAAESSSITNRLRRRWYGYAVSVQVANLGRFARYSEAMGQIDNIIFRNQSTTSLSWSVQPN